MSTTMEHVSLFDNHPTLYQSMHLLGRIVEYCYIDCLWLIKLSLKSFHCINIWNLHQRPLLYHTKDRFSITSKTASLSHQRPLLYHTIYRFSITPKTASLSHQRPLLYHIKGRFSITPKTASLSHQIPLLYHIKDRFSITPKTASLSENPPVGSSICFLRSVLC